MNHLVTYNIYESGRPERMEPLFLIFLTNFLYTFSCDNIVKMTNKEISNVKVHYEQDLKKFINKMSAELIFLFESNSSNVVCNDKSNNSI